MFIIHAVAETANKDFPSASAAHRDAWCQPMSLPRHSDAVKITPQHSAQVRFSTIWGLLTCAASYLVHFCTTGVISWPRFALSFGEKTA